MHRKEIGDRVAWDLTDIVYVLNVAIEFQNKEG